MRRSDESTVHERLAAAVAVVLMIGTVAGLASIGAAQVTTRDAAERTQGVPPLGDLFSKESRGIAEDTSVVRSKDLAGSLDRLAAAADGPRDPARPAQLLDLDERTEIALASILEATAVSIETRDALAETAGITATQTATDPTPADVEELLASTNQLLATIEAHLPALADAAAQADHNSLGTSPASDPDVSLPGLLAIDLEGDTTYEFGYVVKIDLAGNDTHLDSAGGATGGCFVPCPETSVSIDATGEDTYERNLSAEDGDRYMAAQGAARGYGAVGILVDGEGDDTYHVDGDLSMDNPVDLNRMSQGSASSLGVGLLADLGGEDSYSTTWRNVPDRYDRPDCGFGPCEFKIAAQGSVLQEAGTLDPGWGLLVDTEGHDTYTAETGAFPAQGVMDSFASEFDSAERGAAALLDLGGNDAYEGGTLETLNHHERQAVKPSGSGHFLDTDASQPSVRILDPQAGGTLVGESDVTVRARDLADVHDLGVRQVETVTVRIGSIETTAAWPDASDEQSLTVDVSSLAPGTYDLTALATNDLGETESHTVSVVVEDA